MDGASRADPELIVIGELYIVDTVPTIGANYDHRHVGNRISVLQNIKFDRDVSPSRQRGSEQNDQQCYESV